MTLTGTLERPTIDLTSEDGSMTPGEIAAGLVGSTNHRNRADVAVGRSARRDRPRDWPRCVPRRARRLSRTTTSVTKTRRSIGNNRTDPTTRLTVGKRLSDQVEFTVSQNLRENGKATFIVSYFPKPQRRAARRCRATTARSASASATRSRSAAAPTRPPSERRVKPKVTRDHRSPASIRAVAAEVREEIKLDVGDDFDFLNLQRDIDRIRETFHKQGYLEARVRTRRVEAEDARQRRPSSS